MLLVLFLSLPAMAQNTKGDKPQSGGASSKRENRFRSPFKKKDQRTKPPTYKRAQSRGPSRSNSARRPAKSGKASQKFYPQKGRYVNHVSSKPSNKQNSWSRALTRSHLREGSNSGKARNVYPQFGRGSNNNSKKPRPTERAVSNRSVLTKLKRLQGPEPPPPGRKKRITPRSASRSFIARKSINVYANFPRPKHKKGDQPVTKDIAGRNVRTKNYQTPSQGVGQPLFNAGYRRKRIGDRPYRGPASGSYRSATNTKPKAWTGDIAGRKIRGRNFTSKKSIEGQPIGAPRQKGRNRFGDREYRGTIPGGGYRSASQSGEQRGGQAALPRRAFGKGAAKVSGFPGKLKRFESSPGYSDQGEEFTGSYKSRRPLKGGGSVSGKLWNNKQSAVAGRGPSRQAAKASGFPGKIKRFELSPGFSDQGEEFTGTIKTKRPLKGGGSVSGKLWNNKESPIASKAPSATAKKLSGFPGKIKRFELSPGFSDQGEEYRGYIKREKYLRNPSSAELALKVREPGKAFAKSTDYQGNIKMQKFKFFDKKNRGLHPDAQFVKTNKNNVDSERDMLTNFKLWWARLFRKEETQPDHLKEKGKKPRYDKGEEGLWNE